MTSKNKQTGNIKTILKVILFFSILLYFFRLKLLYQPILDNCSTKLTKGKIIDDKNYMRRGHLTGRFTHSYIFSIQGRSYKSDSRDEKYQVNDTVVIEYNEYFPFINRIKGTSW